MWEQQYICCSNHLFLGKFELIVQSLAYGHPSKTNRVGKRILCSTNFTNSAAQFGIIKNWVLQWYLLLWFVFLNSL